MAIRIKSTPLPVDTDDDDCDDPSSGTQRQQRLRAAAPSLMNKACYDSKPETRLFDFFVLPLQRGYSLHGPATTAPISYSESDLAATTPDIAAANNKPQSPTAHHIEISCKYRTCSDTSTDATAAIHLSTGSAAMAIYPIKAWNKLLIEAHEWNGVDLIPVDEKQLPEPFYYWGMFCFPLWITKHLWKTSEIVQYPQLAHECHASNDHTRHNSSNKDVSAHEDSFEVIDSRMAFEVLFKLHTPTTPHTSCTSTPSAELSSLQLEKAARRPAMLEQYIWPLMLSGYDMGCFIVDGNGYGCTGYAGDQRLSRLYIPLVTVHSCYIKPQVCPVPSCLILYNCQDHGKRVQASLIEYFAAVPRVGHSPVYPEVKYGFSAASSAAREMRASLANSHLNKPKLYLQTVLLHIAQLEGMKATDDTLKRHLTTGVSLLVWDGTVCQSKDCCRRRKASPLGFTEHMMSQFERVARLTKPWCQKIAFVDPGLTSNVADQQRLRTRLAAAVSTHRSNRYIEIQYINP
eukprot:Lankesteria_metandrocarpae@DN6366_c0_g1_i1.p1